MNTAVVLAGGTGTRMQSSGVPKQYIMVDGRPVIDYCLTTFQDCASVDAIVVVAAPSWQDFILQWISASGISKFSGFAEPGDTRQGSIYHGLCYAEQALPQTSGVIIHDAARPLVSKKLIENCFDALKNAEGVLPVLPIKDTCYYSEDGTTVNGLIPRKNLFAGQAPEAFSFAPYLALHRTLSSEELQKISGSCELAYIGKMKIAMIPGEEDNFKITTQNDLTLFQDRLHKVRDNK